MSGNPFLSLFAQVDPGIPSIRVYNVDHGEAATDDPDAHRWRATWSWGWDDGSLPDIALTRYPVVRKTPKGAWIDPYALREATKQPWEEGAPDCAWVTHDDHLRWVSDGGGAAWAKRTQEEAIQSIAIRLTRWSGNVRDEWERASAASKALKILRPDLSRRAEDAARILSAMESEE